VDANRALGRVVGNVRVVSEHSDGRKVEAFGPLSEALCQSALKAVTLGRGEPNTYRR